MSYLKWAIAGLIGYTVMAPAISIASARTNSEAALLYSNGRVETLVSERLTVINEK